jgi:polyisoprenyl-phosphate glycosyltransferase
MAEPSPRRSVSLVIPCYNESAVFPYLRPAIAALADELGRTLEVEIIIVDDGSTDGTWALVQEFCASDPRVRGIALSRNFGHQAALTCGYDFAKGDAVVSMDADLQDPPAVVLEMVQKWQEGFDLVHGVRTGREGETRFKLWTAAAFYKLIELLGARHVKRNTGDFRLVSRRALEALNGMRECHRFIRGMAGWVGFRCAEVYYQRKQRQAGTTKYPLLKMWRFAVDAIVSFSTLPLKLSFLAALLIAAVIIGFLGVTTIRYFFFGTPLVPGWTSLILAITAFGTINLICVGLLGEYVGRIYEQVKQRPLYLIQDTETAVEAAAKEANANRGPPDDA